MIGVVGSGLAGLTAAYELVARGYDVRVFDVEDAPGGRLGPLQVDDRPLPVPRYPHDGAPGDEALGSLAETLTDASLSRHRVRPGYYVDGVAYPVGRPWELLAFPSLSLREKLLFRSLRRGGGGRSVGVPRAPFEEPSAYDDVTARSFVTEHATASLYEHAVEPPLRATFGDASEQISAAWLLATFARRSRGQSWRGETVLRPEGGPPSLVDALVSAVGEETVRTDARVLPLGLRDDAVDHLVTVEGGRRREYDVDAVVIATAPSTLTSITSFEWGGREGTTTSVCFGLSESLLEASSVTIVDDAPFGTLVERPTSVSGATDALYALAPTEWPRSEATVDRFRRGVESLFPSFDEEGIRWSAVATAPTIVPQVGYGSSSIPADLSDDVAGGCHYAGIASESQYPAPSLDGAVRAGRAAARSVIERVA